MTQFLPPNLLALFAAREPIPYKPPVGPLAWEKDREKNPYSGVAQYTHLFEEPKDTPPPTRGETKLEKKVRRIKEKALIREKEIEAEAKNYNPHDNKAATGDAFKTLFISRINYDTSESKLRREFDMYGPIRKIIMVKDTDGKPRGYAFIEFEHERDMHAAYKNADGKKIDGRRVVVDVERGRTVKGWRPLRLGGGLGATRRGANDQNVRHSGRSDVREGRGDEGRPRDRRRSGSREKREKRGSRDRDRRDRKDRDRDRDRKRDRDRDRDRGRDREESGKDQKDKDRKHRTRDKSREKDRDGGRRRRSRDRDRNRDKDRDRSDKDRSSRKDKDKDREKVKEESKHDYVGDEGRPQPMEHNNDMVDGYDAKYSSQNGANAYAEGKQESNYGDYGGMDQQG